MTEITVFQLGSTIIVPIQVELHDRAAIGLQEDILARIEKSEISGLIIDVSAISIVDSFLGRLLAETAKMALLMGTTTVLVGLKKEVIMTLLELGLSLQGLYTVGNITDAIELLRELNLPVPSPSDGLVA